MPPQMPIVRQLARLVPLVLLGLAAPWVVGIASFSAHWIAGFALFSLLVSGLVCWKWQNAPDVTGFVERISNRFDWLGVWKWALLAVVAGWLVGGIWLQGFPIADDIYAVMMQAKTFALGKLTVPAPPIPEAFSHPRFVVTRGIWISQYPPGWALLLTPFAWLDLPFWLAPAFFCGGILILFWRIVRRRLEPPLAIITLITLASSPFFVLNASTLYSHAPTAFFGLAAVEAVLTKRAGGGWAWALLAGAMLGAMGLIRPFNAALFVVVLGAALLADWVRARNWQELATIAAFGLGGVPFAVALLGYHFAVTGSPFTTIPEWLGRSEPLGIFNVKTVLLTIHRIGSLMLMTSSLLVTAGAIVPFLLGFARRLDFTDLIFPVTVGAFLFYAGSGGIHQSYGPRYLFEAFPYLVLSLGVGVSLLGRHQPAVRAALTAHLVVQIAGLASWLTFERAAIKALSEPYRLAQQAKLGNALVILQTCPDAYRKCYISDLTRNGLDVTRPQVVYAVDPGDGGAQLRAVFPDRRFWVYRNGALKPLDADAP